MITSRAPTRRSLLLSGIGLLAFGCVESPVVKNAASVFRTQIFGHPDLPLTRDGISKLPYASMVARVGRGPQAVLILARIEGEDQHWISGVDRSVLVIRGGRVVKTFGFPENLKDTHSKQDDPVDRLLHRISAPIEHQRFVDLDVGQHYGLPIESTLIPQGPRKITIVEIELDTIMVREQNRARTVEWNFENLYWVDPGDGFVWKSTQYIARSFPPVHFEIMKPPAAPA